MSGRREVEARRVVAVDELVRSVCGHVREGPVLTAESVGQEHAWGGVIPEADRNLRVKSE